MKPKPRLESNQLDLFQAHVKQLLNHSYPLFILAGTFDWSRFEMALADCCSPDISTPAMSTRQLGVS